MVFQKCVIFNVIIPFSEDLKEADSEKTRSLQALKDENAKLTRDLDDSHRGQSELKKVKLVLVQSQKFKLNMLVIYSL